MSGRAADKRSWMSLWPDDGSLPLLWPCTLIFALVAVRTAMLFAATPLAIVDDQLQHIVPFQHYLPGHPLPRDPVVDFFLSQNGAAYRALFALPASLGIQPTTWAWAVAIACALVSAFAIHGAMRAAGASRSSAAAAVVLLLVYLACRGDLPAAARSLAWPVIFCALWGLARNDRIAFATAASAGALVYPPVAVLALGTASFALLADVVAERSLARALRWLPALAFPVLILLVGWTGDGSWGPSITADAARHSSDFLPGGRTAFFRDDPVAFYLLSPRSGLREVGLVRVPFILPLAAGALLLARPGRPLLRLVLSLAAASLLLWAAAHLLLFRLYLPARFIIFGVSPAAIMIAAEGLGWIAGRFRLGRAAVLLLLLGWTTAVVAHRPQWLGVVSPRAPGLIRAIAASAVPGQVAGLSTELNYVPRFTNRSVYWSPETAFGYRVRYGRLVTARLGETLRALFAPRPEPLLGWAGREQIAALLVDSEYLAPGPVPSIVSGAPGGRASDLPARSDWSRAWLAGQRRCAREEKGVLLFSVACLRAAASARL